MVEKQKVVIFGSGSYGKLIYEKLNNYFEFKILNKFYNIKSCNCRFKGYKSTFYCIMK